MASCKCRATCSLVYLFPVLCKSSMQNTLKLWMTTRVWNTESFILSTCFNSVPTNPRLCNANTVTFPFTSLLTLRCNNRSRPTVSFSSAQNKRDLLTETREQRVRLSFMSQRTWKPPNPMRTQTENSQISETMYSPVFTDTYEINIFYLICSIVFLLHDFSEVCSECLNFRVKTFKLGKKKTYGLEKNWNKERTLIVSLPRVRA